MTHIDRVAFLQDVELFSELHEEQLLVLAKEMELVEFERDVPLFTQGESIEKIYFIISGSIRVFREEEDSRKNITVFTRFEFLNESVLLHPEEKHNASAEVYFDLEALVIKKETMSQILHDSGAIAVPVFSKIAAIIARRMENASYRRDNVSQLYRATTTRSEHDLLGDKEVPSLSYYGIQTLRAGENFDISGILLNSYPHLINSFAVVKKAAALANSDTGQLDEKLCGAIGQACDEIRLGMLHNHFIVDMIQGGAGTSVNMNANEVIANRTLEIMGKPRGSYDICHPNNHVNLSQSTNDAYPTAVKIAIIESNIELVRTLKKLIESFELKSTEFASVIKMGRTQLQDAVPMTLGQSFQAFASALKLEVMRCQDNAELFLKVNMGGTAIGTGINTDEAYSDAVVKHLRAITGFDISLSEDLIAATHDTGSFVMYSSVLKRLAVKLSKICNDLRLLSSGPRAGLNEINLPPMQPGSSIMPGKVNPVIPEVVNQIAFKVIGNDLTVTLAAEAGQLELNVMEPVIVESIFESIEMLKNGMDTLRKRCVDGITANEDRCRSYVENSIGIVTALNPRLGYEISSSLAKEALASGRSIYELVLERKYLTRDELDEILDPQNMIG